MGFQKKYESMPILGDHICGIYLVGTSQNGPIKIGITSRLQERLAALQTSHWRQLTCFGFYLSLPNGPACNYKSMKAAFGAGAKSLERRVHLEMEKHELALMGEWVDVSAEEAKEVLKKSAELNGQNVISLQDAASADIFMLDPAVLMARRQVVRSLAEISIFLSAFNKRGGLIKDCA